MTAAERRDMSGDVEMPMKMLDSSIQAAGRTKMSRDRDVDGRVPLTRKTEIETLFLGDVTCVHISSPASTCLLSYRM